MFKKINKQSSVSDCCIVGDIIGDSPATNNINKITKIHQNWTGVNKKILLAELSRFGYYLGKRIGEGSYSKVYYAEHQGDEVKSFSNSPIACKIIDRRNTSTEYYEKFLPRELCLIQKISHPNIISVHSILEMGPFVCVFMDFCSHGDLLDRIRNRGALNEKKARLFFSQIVSAINYLHSIDISHRDIKCENILIQNRYCVKLTDFGFARKVIKNGKIIMSKTFCGSASYTAPEILKGISYNPKKNDMWSLGCVLYIMICGSMPYDDENLTLTIQKQEKHQIDYPQNFYINPEIKQIIRTLLHPNVMKRASVLDIINQPWILL